MTTTSEPPASTAAAARRAQEQISPGFFRGAFAMLIVGTLLSLGAFATVAYSGSLARTGSATSTPAP